MDSSYCVKCKTKTESIGSVVSKTKNGRNIAKSKCARCGTNKTRFLPGVVKKTGKGWGAALALASLL